LEVRQVTDVTGVTEIMKVADFMVVKGIGS